MMREQAFKGENPTRKTTAVPIVDFAPILDPSSTLEAKRKVGEAIFQAFRDVGFVYLSNYLPSTQSKNDTSGGLSLPTKSDIDEAFSFSKRFFALPREAKMKCPHPPEGWWHRGYSSIGREKVFTYSSVIKNDTNGAAEEGRQILELKESYELGREGDEVLKNIWPPEEENDLEAVRGFREYFNGFYQKCHNLGQLVLASLARGMGIDEGFFEKYHKTKANQLRLLHYPEVDYGSLDPKNVDYERIVAHTDLGTMTLLFQEDEQKRGASLEVENPDEEGSYIEAPSIPGTMLVNIGDLLQRWTNDVLKSTKHRVGVPRLLGRVQEEKLPARYSIPYFIAPDPGTVICGIEGIGERKYEEVEAYEYILSRLSKAY